MKWLYYSDPHTFGQAHGIYEWPEMIKVLSFVPVVNTWYSLYFVPQYIKRKYLVKPVEKSNSIVTVSKITPVETEMVS
jgi:hypothetical protein